jgi:hypothetical protein
MTILINNLARNYTININIPITNEFKKKKPNPNGILVLQYIQQKVKENKTIKFNSKI